MRKRFEEMTATDRGGAETTYSRLTPPLTSTLERVRRQHRKWRIDSCRSFWLCTKLRPHVRTTSANPEHGWEKKRSPHLIANGIPCGLTSSPVSNGGKNDP